MGRGCKGGGGGGCQGRIGLPYLGVGMCMMGRNGKPGGPGRGGGGGGWEGTEGGRHIASIPRVGCHGAKSYLERRSAPRIALATQDTGGRGSSNEELRQP